MNSHFQEGEGRATITPSARKSIHYRDEMVQRPLKQSPTKPNETDSQDNPEQGMDLVDGNTMSKLHSKSLPTTLPSHLYYSTGIGLEESVYSSLHRLFEDSNRSQLLNSSNESSEYNHQNYSDASPRTIEEKERAKSTQKAESNKPQSLKIFIVTSLIAVIIAVLYIKDSDTVLPSDNGKLTHTVYYDETLFENSMNKLQEKYNINWKSILQLKSGISTIFSNMDAGSFVFVYDSNADSFDATQFEKFIDEAAHISARYLRNNVSSVKHTVVLSSTLDMQEHGELISRYRDDVDKTGVLLVKEVDSVPSDLAMAFHYYCDEFHPLVKKSAIFFTLNLANCSNALEKETTHDVIEKCLAGKWKTVPSENIRPLLTRVVDIVIDVTRF